MSSNDKTSNLVIDNVRLPHTDPELAQSFWKVECRDGHVSKVTPSSRRDNVSASSRHEIDAKGSLMLPSLCHSHIHLDKCFILDRCGDLVTGDFAEAMKVTAEAKSRFALDKHDLYQRAHRLIRESVQCGVTAMRAHVEVDTIVGFACLEVGLQLQAEWSGICDVQIAAFAQEPLFTSSEALEPGENFTLLQQAASKPGVTVVGSAPYVEPSVAQAKQNISLLLELATRFGHHADFHLDYNLDPASEPLIYDVIAHMRADAHHWRTSHPRVTVGHATRLQLLSPAQWHVLADAMRDLPISLVGLPQSDMYMMGRADAQTPLGAPRGTLRVPQLAEKFGVQAAMAVNNVQNAFTPQGAPDPLALCTLGVALFQTAVPRDLRALASAVTLTSKRAIGQSAVADDLCPRPGDPADFVLLHGNASLAAAVLAPSHARTTIRGGRIVARRTSSAWTALAAVAPWYRRVRWWLLVCPPWFLWTWLRGQLIVPAVPPLDNVD